jgi:hypothetical protein
MIWPFMLLALSESDSSQRLRESVIIWRQLVHPNIVRLFGVDGETLQATGEIRLIMPHFNSLNLMDLVLGSAENTVIPVRIFHS